MQSEFHAESVLSVRYDLITNRVLPWWAWLIIIVVILCLFFLVYLWIIRTKTQPSPTPQIPKDDLTKIEGIGPKIQGMLNKKNISSYKQLADTPGATLVTIIEESNLRIANPSTWPEQALLASKGEWEKLSKLQEELKGGKRI
jgi:hypothetical protein